MNKSIWTRHYNKMRFLCYGPDEDAAAAAAAAAANNDDGSPEPLPDDNALPEGARGKATFTQAELNKFLADDRRKHRAQLEKENLEKKKTLDQLEQLKKSKGLSDAEKDKLQTRIEELNNSMLTKEQLAAKEKEKLETTYKHSVQGLTAERDLWKDRFVKAQINQTITSEAQAAKAFDAEALIALLGPNTRLAEDKDTDGNPLESFTPRVKFNDVDQEKKPVTLDLTIPEAVKRMKDTPKFAYLFESTAVGGLGGNGGVGGKTGQPDPKGMSQQQYRDYRKKQGYNRSSTT